jgi:uncharacterized membrane protein YcaP (DUF421 family)
VSLGAIAVRSLVAYGWLLLLLRLDGKRGIGQASAFDFVLALVLGDLVDNLLWGEVSPPIFLTATAALVAVHLMVSIAGYRSRRLSHLVNGLPILAVASGTLVPGAMRRERMHPSELLGTVRENGIGDLRAVRTGRIETSGKLSTLLHDWARPLRRSEKARVGLSRAARPEAGD